jgi:hypothetical protein
VAFTVEGHGEGLTPCVLACNVDFLLKMDCRLCSPIVNF